MRIRWIPACLVIGLLGLGLAAESASAEWPCSPPPVRYEVRTITRYRPEYRTGWDAP